MPCCYVKLPFGEEIVADYDVEYELDCEGVDEYSIKTTCEGFWVGRPGDQDRRYVAFTAKAGPEATLRDRFVEVAEATWKGRIQDACLRHAEENKEVNRLVRG